MLSNTGGSFTGLTVTVIVSESAKSKLSVTVIVTFPSPFQWGEADKVIVFPSTSQFIFVPSGSQL